jgi:hypothetical protein
MFLSHVPNVLVDYPFGLASHLLNQHHSISLFPHWNAKAWDGVRIIVRLLILPSSIKLLNARHHGTV